MAAISVKEFYALVELLENDTNAFNEKLCILVDKVLASSVRKWCCMHPELSYGGRDQELMQSIQARVFTTCVTSFFLRNGVEGPINNDSIGFEKWLYTVANNLKRDAIREVRRDRLHIRYFEEGEAEQIVDNTANVFEEATEPNEHLLEAFAAVLDSKCGVHVKLTWLAHCVFEAFPDEQVINTSDRVHRVFGNKTLYEMRDIVFGALDLFPWKLITKQSEVAINDALNQQYTEGVTYGTMLYSDFFMQKGGKASISHWVYRGNDIVKRRFENDASNS